MLCGGWVLDELGFCFGVGGFCVVWLVVCGFAYVFWGGWRLDLGLVVCCGREGVWFGVVCDILVGWGCSLVFWELLCLGRGLWVLGWVYSFLVVWGKLDSLVCCGVGVI